jgi:hypothetical protein
MNKAVIFLIAAGALSILAGCNENKNNSVVPETVQTVDWYKTHTSERDTVLAKCRANPGETAASPNCINATRADSATTWGAKGAGVKPVAPLTADQIKK